MNLWQLSDLGFLVLAAIAGTLFMVIYSVRTPWWRHRPGDDNWEHRVHLAAFTGTLAAMLWLYVFRAVIPVPAFVIVRRVFFDLVALLMVWRLVLLIRSKRRALTRENADRTVR